MGKTVITIDLNPLSRTAQLATITIVDNVTRAVPLLLREVERLRFVKPAHLRGIVSGYDNRKTLSEAIRLMEERLHSLAEKGVYIELGG
jgi:4-phosphopantoate--beta-alanine ligase